MIAEFIESCGAFWVSLGLSLAFVVVAYLIYLFVEYGLPALKVLVYLVRFLFWSVREVRAEEARFEKMNEIL